MTVHLFGAVSSPSFALRRAAKDNSNSFPKEVINTVTNNFNVDDLLKRVPTEEDAVLMVQNLAAICKMGGFKLTKWISNSRKVLYTIAKDHHVDHLKSDFVLRGSY